MNGDYKIKGSRGQEVEGSSDLYRNCLYSYMQLTVIVRNGIPLHQCDSYKDVIARSFSDLSRKSSRQAPQSPQRSSELALQSSTI